jgi:LuxR family maltose regulon positive regulatory protein
MPDRERLEVESDVLLIRLTIAVMQDDTELAERLLREFDPALADRDAWSSDIVNSCVAFVRLHAGDAHGARQFLPCVYPFKRVYQQVVLAISWLREAKPSEAEREMARAQELALGEFGAGSISNLLCEALLAATYYERGQFERVEAGVGRRLAMLDEVAPTDAVIPAYCAVAWSRAARGVPEQAEVLLNHLRKLGAERGWLRAEAVALLEMVRLRLSGGSAVELGDIAPRLSEIAGGPMPAVQCARSTAMRAARIGAAVCAAMQRIGDQALGPLAAVVKEVEEFEAPALAMKAELLLARVCWEHRAASRARETLNRAVERATGLGMRQTVRDAGAWTRAVGNAAMAALVQSDEGAVPTAAQAGPKREDLSLREMEILQLVGRGFSNKEIGKALKIGPETVKWHMKNLFAKLGVINRMQAVNRARSSALLA